VCHNEVKQRVFQGRKPKPLKFSDFKTFNSFPFNKAPKKTAPLSAVFRPASRPHPLQQGCNRMGGNEVLRKGAMSVTYLGKQAIAT